MVHAYPINKDASNIIEELMFLPAFYLNCLNWKEFPYKPAVSVRLGYTNFALAILFEVEEDHVRAVTMDDCGPVWEDSCCEFFVSNPVGEGYFNFEINCVGTLLAAKRRSREDFQFLTESQLLQIKRFSTLPHIPIDSVEAGQKYRVAELIPFSIFGLEGAPKSLKANFYKCGDMCQNPHFLSLAPINLPSPNFHCPEFFQDVIFEH